MNSSEATDYSHMNMWCVEMTKIYRYKGRGRPKKKLMNCVKEDMVRKRE